MTNTWSITPANVSAEDWPDKAGLSEAGLNARLDAAQAQCLAYAPTFDTTGKTLPGDLPSGWLLAVIYQARDIHNASKRTGDSQLSGDAAYPIRIRPLSDTVKQLLRPQRRVGPFG